MGLLPDLNLLVNGKNHQKPSYYGSYRRICIKNAINAQKIFIVLHFAHSYDQNDEKHMPEATGPLPWPQNDITNSAKGKGPIVINNIILYIPYRCGWPF